MATSRLLDECLSEAGGVHRYRGSRELGRRLIFWHADRLGSRFFKRVLDLLAGFFGLGILVPLSVLVFVAVKLEDGGPVFFRQTRVGKKGKRFTLWKFRSMKENAEALKSELLSLNRHDRQVTFKMEKDPRVTWVGGILRKWSLDEVPQFWNILKGDMSLIGPRPALPGEVENYSALELRRLIVKPGLTGLWQVSGRGDLPFCEQAKLDIKHIREESFAGDLKLLAKTIPAVLQGRGAY